MPLEKINFDDTNLSLRILANKINEIIDVLNEKKEVDKRPQCCKNSLCNHLTIHAREEDNVKQKWEAEEIGHLMEIEKDYSETNKGEADRNFKLNYWEKEFDNKFCDDFALVKYVLENKSFKDYMLEVKQFIRNLLK